MWTKMCEQIENFIRVVVSYKKYQIERIEIKYLLVKMEN